MSKSLDKIEKDSASDESSDSKTVKSDSPLSQTKERRKSTKKKMLRSGNRRPRLSGGADESASPAAESRGVSIKEEVESHNGTLAESRSVPDTPPSSPVSCPKDTLAKTGDPKADEILECAMRNLEEAGKALASLGTNLEHELKLFLVDLMNRTRKWSASVEGKAEWCRRDVISLSKELAAHMESLEQKLREAQEVRDQLAKSEEMRSLADRSGKADDGTSRAVDGAASMRHDPSGMDACGASISACAQPSFIREGGDSDIAAYKAEQQRLEACCAELEEEVCCLKKENERIVKERAEYENAIQRALLKGVSSLNVEALKVLRCTPIPSCCPPCPPSSSVEPMSKSRDCTSPRSQQQRDGCGGGGNGGNGCGNGGHGGRAGASKSCTSTNSRGNGNGNGGGGRVCPASGHERKSKKSKDNNMLLLLHQKDAENFGIQGGCDSQKKSNDCGKQRRASHYQC